MGMRIRSEGEAAWMEEDWGRVDERAVHNGRSAEALWQAGIKDQHFVEE